MKPNNPERNRITATHTLFRIKVLSAANLRIKLTSDHLIIQMLFSSNEEWAGKYIGGSA